MHPVPLVMQAASVLLVVAFGSTYFLYLEEFHLNSRLITKNEHFSLGKTEFYNLSSDKFEGLRFS